MLSRRSIRQASVLFFLLSLAATNFAQCSYDNVFLADMTPAYSGDTTFNSCIKAGEYITINAISGNTYVFSTCGYTGFNTQMTLRNASGTVWYAFNDNFCGQQSQITWNATFTGQVKLLIDEAPSCLHNSICQEIWVTHQCKSNAGSFTTRRNNTISTQPVYVCEGSDTLTVHSDNNFQLPVSAPGEQAELIYLVYSCPRTRKDPALDPCFTSIIIPSKNFTDQNPGILTTGNRYFLVPVTVDDGDNGGNPNNQINIDLDGDSCYSFGPAIEVVYLNPLAFASNIDCLGRAVKVKVVGGRSEYDNSIYSIVNTGAGTITGPNVKHGDTVTISGLSNGSFYSFDVVDANGCTASFSGGPFYSPNAGNDNSISLCITDSTIDLSGLLSGGQDSTGKWYNPNNNLSSSFFTPGINLPGTWKYVVDGAFVCENDSAFFQIHVDSMYKAGNDSSKLICQYDAMVNLWPLLSIDADSQGTWHQMNGTAFSGILPNTSNYYASRKFKYVVNIGSSCARDSSIHTIFMTRHPRAGRDSIIAFCDLDPAKSMIQYLGNNPDTTGLWYDPMSNPHNGNFLPGSDASGTYKYLVSGNNPCPDDSANLTVTIVPSEDAGKDSALSFCQSDTGFVLHTLLDSAISHVGNWYDNSNNLISPAVFNPSVQPGGTYQYRLNGSAPCPDDIANWNLSVIMPPNPGPDDSTWFCSNNNPISLYNVLSSSADTFGFWLNSLQDTVSGLFNPALDSNTVFTYTVPAGLPCSDSSASHYVGIISAPDPGRDTMLGLCSNSSPINLFNFIPGSPESGGQWHDPFNNATIMPFLPGSSSEGNYSYTLSGQWPCADSTSVISVNVEDAVNPGKDTAISLCTIDSAIQLFSVLGGSPDANGFWTDSKGTTFSGLFDPMTASSDTFYYTVPAISPCQDSTSNVIVNVFNAPNAGAGGMLTICSNQDSILMLSLIGGTPDTYGFWKEPGGTLHSGTLYPGIDSSGTYTYIVPGSGSCSDTLSLVNVQIVPAPNPGLSDSVSFCSNDNQTSLINYLASNPDPNGSWTNSSGNPFSGIFYPPIDVAGIYTYTVAGTAPCKDSSSSVKVKLSSFSNPGTNGSIDVCETDPIFSLISVLNGSPQSTGIWYNYLNQPLAGFFNPAIDTTALFRYTVPGKSPCADSSAFVQVNVKRDVNAGRDTTLEFCNNMPALNIFNLIPGNPEPGGMWTAPNSLPFNGVFNPALDSGGIFKYEVVALAPCPDKVSLIDVKVKKLYDPGIGGSLIICENASPFNFFTKLTGSPDITGYWIDPNGYIFDGQSSSVDLITGNYAYIIPENLPCPEDSAIIQLDVNKQSHAGKGLSKTVCETDEPADLFTLLTDNPDTSGLWYSPTGNFTGGFFNPGTDLPGVYKYVVQGEFPCPNDSAFISLEVAQLPTAGPDQNLVLCFNTGSVNLFERLKNPGNPGGVWYDPLKRKMSGIFTPGKHIIGKYTYVLPANAYCPGDSMKAQLIYSEPFELDAGRDIVLLYGERKMLKVTSFEAERYSWEPETGLSNAHISDPFVFCESTTTYIVSGIDKNDCTVSDTVKVSVYPNIFVPNSFTPNRDGINDDWIIPGLESYSNFTVVVLNNDRIVVYESHESGQWWDGSYNGEFVPSGKYFYRIIFHDKVRFSDLSGVLNVIR